MFFPGEGGAGFLRAAPHCRSWVLRQQTQPKSTTCVPRVVFREGNAVAERFPFISDIPAKACSLLQRMPVLGADGWTAPEKPNCYLLEKAAKSTMDFEERNDLYVVGELG